MAEAATAAGAAAASPTSAAAAARHSVATQLVIKGVSMKAVQETYGHTTMRTTEGYVDTVIDKEKEQIDDALNLEI